MTNFSNDTKVEKPIVDNQSDHHANNDLMPMDGGSKGDLYCIDEVQSILSSAQSEHRQGCQAQSGEEAEQEKGDNDGESMGSHF